MKNEPGTVYLIHFTFPYQARTGAGIKRVQHYTGWATDLLARLAEHRSGKGARLMQVIHEAGIPWEVARTWPGDRNLERRLKRRKKARCLCPICRQAAEEAAAAARKAAESQLTLFSKGDGSDATR
jgi:predicted GIY-YIG superfamily endonuclease